MLITNIIDEDTTNYKKLAMFVGLPYCDGKCWRELGFPSSICINDDLRNAEKINMSVEELIERYNNNPLTESVVFGGMEPFDSWNDLYEFVVKFRANCKDDIVIYTGYKEDEIADKVAALSKFPRMIVKFGRFNPNGKSRYDDVLGLTLVSDNQYAKVISQPKIIVNPNENIVRDIRAGLVKNEGYCPCRLDKTPDTKCMCKEFREQSEGECHCGLYIKI